MKKAIRKFHWILSNQLGFNVKSLFRSIAGIPKYAFDWFRFRRIYRGELNFLPCLNDWNEEGGSTKSEYFWQDLYIAQKIYKAKPSKHVDIGSRVDGFVAHVASFRTIEILDIRPVSALIPGVVFTQADLMSSTSTLESYSDSVSCLHALEHFGLGRYGDPIDPDGHIAGLSNIAKMLCPNGIFYLSVPIGRERVEFNAHRVLAPSPLVSAAGRKGLKLVEFAWFEPGKSLVQSENAQEDFARLEKIPYALGIFTFIKQ